jgi:K+-sensing histidine kinase KdpD
MSDFFERIDASDRDGSDPATQPEEAGLINRVSAAGFQVSQALEGLEQVTGLLRAAEELAKDADARRRTAEGAAALSEAQAKELGELLEMARSDAVEIERRLTRAEERASRAEDETARVIGKVDELGELLAIARSDAADVERRVAVADERASQAEDEAALAMAQARELGGLLDVARSDTADVDRRVALAEERAAQAEDEAAFAAGRARELGELLAIVRSDAADVERRATDAEERATHAEDRLQQALERAFTLEAELEEANGRAPAAKMPRRLTVIVDDQRNELRDAVASEIRRPLTSIMGLTLALKHADATSTEGKQMVRQMGASARRLERLVVQLLELDGIANGSYTPSKRRADLKAIVRRVVEETPDLDGLDVRVHAEHAAIEVDPALAEQMVETLLANAARRSEPGGPLWVQVSSDTTGAIIAVDDASVDVPAGMGSDPEEGATAHQNKTKRATGLALLSRLAELHGGRAWVEERAGGGASFRVFLPSGAVPGAPVEPSSAASDDEATGYAFEEDADHVVLDATAIGSREPEPDPHPRNEADPEQSEEVDVYAGLRELSSFDDLAF